MDPSDLQSLSNLRHEQMGSISLNLLGGSTEERTEPNSDFFILRNENVCCTYLQKLAKPENYYRSFPYHHGVCSTQFLKRILPTGAQFIIFQKMLGSKRNTSTGLVNCSYRAPSVANVAIIIYSRLVQLFQSHQSSMSTT